jgi:bla regulator protein blaR1
MTNLLVRVALAMSDSTDLAIVAKATVVVGLALAAVSLTRRARASVRHLVLASAFSVLLTLPALVAVLPARAIHVPVALVTNVAHPPAPIERSADDTVGARGSPNTATAGRGSLSILRVLRVIWVAGVLLFLTPLALSLWRLRRICRTGIPWLDGEPNIKRLAAEPGVRWPVDVLVHEAVQVPLTCGFVRPAIVLPADTGEWSEADIRHAMAHELEHVRRADWPFQVMARVVCALYWFHPLVWAAWRRLGLEAERACDDAVLRGADGPAYAEQLVRLAQRLSKSTGRYVLSMANRSDLSTRVSAVLDMQQRRGRAGAGCAAAIAMVAFVLTVGISPLRAVDTNEDVATSNELRVPAQTSQPLDDIPSFEVASIKLNRSGEWRVSGGFSPGGRYRVTNYPLRSLIAAAYLRPQINPDFLIAGGPTWIDTSRFDIEAKAPADFPPGPEGPSAPRRVMLQKLLADRFGLSVHHETVERSVYALLMARSDHKLGPQLRPTGVDCAALAVRAGSISVPSAQSSGVPSTCSSRVGPGAVMMKGLTLSPLVNLLPRFVDRVVIDHTGLTGAFDIELKWTPGPGEWVAPGLPGGDPAPPADVPSLFTALQEQLGLKLESTKGPVDILIIDHAEMPTED